MCGIGGAFAFADGYRLDIDRLAAARDRMAHRGPDGQGLWLETDGSVGLVHRRLSVIDIETGQQPLVSSDGSLVIVFNGEIYNYIELRRSLEAAGAQFRTTSDTEVVLESYRLHGPSCLGAFYGMFAFAIWDRKRRTLFAARDRIGKKPLFHAVDDGTFYFASTLDALRAMSPADRDVDIAAVDDYLALAYIPAPRSIWRGISKLPAGHQLRVDRHGPVISRYWSIDQSGPPFEGTYDDAVDRLDALVDDAVRLRLRSDVPLGVFLSGGIDSSLVTAVAARHMPGLQTFTVGFDEQDFDESGHAHAISRHLETRHHVFRGHRQMLDLQPEVASHYGEPFGDSSSINVWQLARFARPHITVALGGDGGDEGFLGYDWYRRAMALDANRRRLPYAAAIARLTSRALHLPARISPGLARARRALHLIGADTATQFATQRAFIDADDVASLYRGNLLAARQASAETATQRHARLYRESRGSELNRMRRVDVEAYLADCLMPKIDVATMAHGLEARAPLLDHRILEFAATLPDQWATDTSTGKLLLRDVLARYVPRPLFERPKTGFSLPLRTWFATSLRDRLDRMAQNSALMDTGWIDQHGLRRLIAEHADGVRVHTDRLYSLVALDQWLSTHT